MLETLYFEVYSRFRAVSQFVVLYLIFPIVVIIVKDAYTAE